MMEASWYAAAGAILAYFGVAVLCSSPVFLGKIWDRTATDKKYGVLFYTGILAESMAITAGTAGIVLTLAYVPLGEALLATGMLGFCFAVVTLFTQTVNPVTVHSILRGIIISGYRLLGILLVTVILYQGS